MGYSFFWLLFSLLSNQIWPSTSDTDFCALPCGISVNPGCDCSKIGHREEEGFDKMDDIMGFRTTILNKVNQLRNDLAGGKENRTPYAPNASNMMAVNYDEDLEYTARCFAVKYNSGHACSRTPAYEWTSQFVGNSNKSFLDNEHIKQTLQNMYDEVRFISKSTINEYYNMQDPAKNIEHFANIAWWSMVRIGCARVWNEHPPYQRTLPAVLVCNYGVHKDDALAQLNYGFPIYKNGTACSNCPSGTFCKSIYPNLCGDVLPIPTGNVRAIPQGPMEEPATPKPPNKPDDDTPPGGSAVTVNVLAALVVIPLLNLVFK